MNSTGAPNPDQPRTLADVLREAGIEPTGRGGRRRRAEPAEGDPDNDVTTDMASGSGRGSTAEADSAMVAPDGTGGRVDPALRQEDGPGAAPTKPRRHRRRDPESEDEGEPAATPSPGSPPMAPAPIVQPTAAPSPQPLPAASTQPGLAPTGQPGLAPTGQRDLAPSTRPDPGLSLAPAFEATAPPLKAAESAAQSPPPSPVPAAAISSATRARGRHGASRTGAGRAAIGRGGGATVSGGAAPSGGGTAPGGAAHGGGAAPGGAAPGETPATGDGGSDRAPTGRVRPATTPTAAAGTSVADRARVVGDPAGTATGRAVSRRTGVLGWFAFGLEVVAAAVLGVLIWYAFSLLWELYPYGAAVAAPLVLAGVVTAGQWQRRRSSQEPLGLTAVAALLVVAAFLVVLPAASVLARS